MSDHKVCTVVWTLDYCICYTAELHTRQSNKVIFKSFKRSSWSTYRLSKGPGALSTRQHTPDLKTHKNTHTLTERAPTQVNSLPPLNDLLS